MRLLSNPTKPILITVGALFSLNEAYFCAVPTVQLPNTQNGHTAGYAKYNLKTSGNTTTGHRWITYTRTPTTVFNNKK